MTARANVAIAVLTAVVAGLVVQLGAAGDKVAFPDGYSKGVLYWVQDRPANRQVREYYTIPAAIEAAKKGLPMPSGTVITVVQYNVQLDGQNNPVTSADGRFIKTDIRGYTAMEKRAGWGVEYPADMRNGEWEYQSFLGNGTPNGTADLKTCFTCHRKVEQADFVYSLDQMKAAK